MKKLSLFTFCLMLATLAFSQESNQEESKTLSPFMPEAGDFGVTVLINGLIDNISLEATENDYNQKLIFGRYYLEDDFVLRAGLGFSINTRSRNTSDSVGTSLVEVDSSRNNFLINISAGVEKHFNRTKRLDPYAFGQMDLSFIGKTNTEINRTETTAAGEAKRERTIKEDGGIGIGLSGGFGFNYFVAKNFSLGSELGMGFLFVNQGGTISDNEIITPVNGSATSNFSKREDQLNTFNFSVQPQATINISYFF